MLQDVHWNAHERGMSDSEDVARLEIFNSNEEKDLSPGCDEVFLNREQVGLR